MYNDILKIGPVTIHGYGLMIAIGVLCAFFTAGYRAKKKGLDPDVMFSLGLTAVVFGFICAKLLYVIVEFKAFLANPISIISNEGFVVYGGLIGGVIAAIVWTRIKKADFLRYFDLAAPSVAIAQGFGRIGCLLAGCCYGCRTDSFLAIVFPDGSIAPGGVRLFPTQAISSAGNFIIAGILLLYARKERLRGRVGALYLMLYSSGRFAIEFFRDDYRGSIGFLSTSQFIAVFIFTAGILLFFRERLIPIIKSIGTSKKSGN